MERKLYIVVDIDGTVALKGNRNAYDERRVLEDTVNEIVVQAVVGLQRQTGAEIVFVSGRTAGCRADTLIWLSTKMPKFGMTNIAALFMREVGDRRKDSVVKEEIYRNKLEPYGDVIAVFDDRQQVVDMWRSLGLTCFQVAAGNF